MLHHSSKKSSGKRWHHLYSSLYDNVPLTASPVLWRLTINRKCDMRHKQSGEQKLSVFFQNIEFSKGPAIAFSGWSSEAATFPAAARRCRFQRLRGYDGQKNRTLSTSHESVFADSFFFPRQLNIPLCIPATSYFGNKSI